MGKIKSDVQMIKETNLDSIEFNLTEILQQRGGGSGSGFGNGNRDSSGWGSGIGDGIGTQCKAGYG